MSIFKCKMCGGTLEINNNETVAVCEYCDSKQTLPRLDNDRRANLYDRANHFRRNNDFDKAMGIYEQILNDDSTDAEAYWSLVLCRYGIEYVEDPVSRKRIPTINRAQFISVLADEDYKSALQYADTYQKTVYEEEAKAIDEIQKGILEISQKEEPFDVFICYKETDSNGRRTPDSVLANDLYHQLVQEGLKVFFARITLEDKLGSAYEPYIFAALNSAKVMVVLGTKAEYFNAVWVKNEWSRYLGLIKNGANKTLIPAYKDMDPYDLPDEFSHLQAQDMSKLGFMQDLIRGIRKIAAVDNQKEIVTQKIVESNNANTESLLRRAFMFLEDGEWKSADEYCEKVLDIEPENARAYLGKLMAEMRVHAQVELADCDYPFDNRNNYAKVMRFGDDNLKADLQGYIKHINTRNENARLDGIYSKAKNIMSSANTEDAYKEAAQLFETIGEYMDSAILAQDCYEKAEIAKKDVILADGKSKMYSDAVSDYEAAVELFESFSGWENEDVKAYARKRKAAVSDYKSAISLFMSISGWKDADEQIIACKKKLAEIKAKAESERLERERQAEIDRIEEERIAKKNKRMAIIATAIVCAVAVFLFVWATVIIPNNKYNDAITLMDAGKYTEAISAFEALDGYKDSASKITECNTAILDGKYNDAIALMESGEYIEAISAFEALDGYKDSATKITECNTAILDGKYNDAITLMDAGKYTEAISAFEALDGYKDSATKITECNTAILDGKYNDAIALMDAGNTIEAYEALAALEGYKDSADKASSIFNKYFAEKYKDIKVGDYIKLGAYEQDNNAENGKEYIEWLVLEATDERIFVVSRYALDCQAYNEIDTDVTWETCSLRKWLNNEFFEFAFSDEEKEMIPIVTVSEDISSETNVNNGKLTQDKVFLLSKADANKYFDLCAERTCKATGYAEAQGLDVSISESTVGNCSWWLRPPGDTQNNAARVSITGGITVHNVDVDEIYAVRPALWIDLEGVE